MEVNPDQFLRALADLTRLRIVMLLVEHPELCVCELTEALQMVQPKVSRHLAILRRGGVLKDRREGLWIHYRLHPDLPAWGLRTIEALHNGCRDRTPYVEDRKRLEASGGAGSSCEA